MTDDDVNRRWMAIVRAQPLPLEDACRSMLEHLFDAASTRIADDVRGTVALDEAETSLGTLLDDMRQQARILRIDALVPSALVSALERRCPLPPFC